MAEGTIGGAGYSHRDIRAVIVRTTSGSAIDAPHPHIRPRERACEALVIFASQARIRELATQCGVIPGPIRRGPPHRGAVLRTRLADRGASVQMDESAEVLGPFIHLIRRDMRELRELAARFLARLPPHRIFRRLAVFHATTWQEPRAGEWPAPLTDEKHSSVRVDARDDRADAPPHGVRVGVGATVRPEGNGGNVSDGTTKGVPLGLTVCPGLKAGEGDGEGEGDGDGLGQGSEPTRFQL